MTRSPRSPPPRGLGIDGATLYRMLATSTALCPVTPTAEHLEGERKTL